MTAIIVGWLICSLFAAGQSYAVAQRLHPVLGQFSRIEDSLLAILLSTAGPISVILSLYFWGWHGWALPFSTVSQYTRNSDDR